MSDADAPDTIAAVDIGTNSFHLVVARSSEPGRFEVIAREKEMVRLGNGAPDMRELAPDAIDRGVAALNRMRQVAEIHDAAFYAVATSAVREAENAKDFLRRARQEAGVKVDVISGVEEARLIYLGVLQALPVFDKRVVLIDIGGGSTEVLVGRKGHVIAAGSLKLGAIRLTRRFFRNDVLHPAAVDTSRRHVRAVFAPVAREVARRGFEVAVGSSGTIEAVAQIIHANRPRSGPTPRTFNAFEFTRDEVRSAVQRLASASTLAERLTIKGVDDKRADILLGGAVILDEAMAALGIEQMVLSDFALREGVLLDVLQRRRGSARHHLRDLRRQSVEHMADLMDDDRLHSDQVAVLALDLFDRTRELGLHALGDESRELLEAAALLCNVGTMVSHDAHHKHSYYVIRNTDHLMGFTDHEIELIALVARYHRKGEPKSGHAEFSALSADNQVRVRTLAGILRVAIGLDRTHAGLVKGVRARVTGPTTTTDERSDTSKDETAKSETAKSETAKSDTAKSDDEPRLVLAALPSAKGADLSLELYSAGERSDLLAQVVGLPVDIVLDD